MCTEPDAHDIIVTQRKTRINQFQLTQIYILTKIIKSNNII